MNHRYKKLATPYKVWLYILALAPIVVMFILSFVKTEGISMDDAKLSFWSFNLLFDQTTIVAIGNSFLYATISTIISLILGYFVAYQLYKSKIKNKLLVLLIFVLPMWSNLLLRTESIGNIMEPNNILTDLLSKININLSMSIKGTPLAVVIGLVFTYLPFVILPVYTALEKIELNLEEASLDLGLTPIMTFWKVIFPLSLKGVITGTILVFLPSFSGFAVPEILGKGNVLFIGVLIEQAFKNMNYGFGSLLSILIIFMIFIAILIVNKVDKEGETLL